MLQMFTVQIGCADFGEVHAEFARQKASEGYFELRIREKENALALQTLTMTFQCALCTLARDVRGLRKALGRYARTVRSGTQPFRRAFNTKRKRRHEMRRAPLAQGTGGLAKKRLGQQEACVLAHGGQAAR